MEDLLRGFSATGRDDVLLRVFVLHDPVFERLKTYFDIPVSNEWRRDERPTRPIRVFVSYTRTDDAHAAWVKELATFLRANGIEARLDVWYLRPGMDTPQWMSNELDLADRVLLVCDRLYAQKADRRHGGVGWEIRIIQGDLLASQEDNPDKYIPIIVTTELDAGTPKFLRGTFALHWPESSPERSQTARRASKDNISSAGGGASIGSPPELYFGFLKLADLVPDCRVACVRREHQARSLRRPEQVTFPPLAGDRYPASGHPLPHLPPHRRVPARSATAPWGDQWCDRLL